jgi:hypothetical protein
MKPPIPDPHSGPETPSNESSKVSLYKKRVGCWSGCCLGSALGFVLYLFLAFVVVVIASGGDSAVAMVPPLWPFYLLWVIPVLALIGAIIGRVSAR